MPVALETFLSQLSDSGLLPEEKLKVVLSKKTNFADGEALARDMIKSNLLTKYQAEQILGGRTKHLVMGKYQILEKIGAGGMGQVYKAYHSGTGRVVAIKVILSKSKIDPEVIRRFEREVKAAAKLVHQNIITVFDADQINGRVFMVMEYIKGNDLAEIILKKGKLSVVESVKYIIQTANGLKYAHDQGVIHRDIKPGNIIVGTDGSVKIVDMGLAKIETDSNQEDISMLTGATSIMGTVDFMSPEQGFSSRDVDARADIYSLGATLFYLLTGKFMYAGNSAFAKLLAHRESPIPSLCSARPGIPIELGNLFTKMVAKNAVDRFQSMAEVILALSSLGNQDVKTTHFDRSSIVETLIDGAAVTMAVKEVNILSAKEPVKEPVKEPITPDVVLKPSLIKSTIQKLYKPKAVVVAVAILVITLVFVFFVLIKPNLNEESDDQREVVLRLKQEDDKAKQLEVVRLKEEKEAKAKQDKIDLEDSSREIELDLVLIPVGKFMMGDPGKDHEVLITKSFFMGRHEVTQEQWKKVMGNNPSAKTKGPTLPVTDVSWNDCQEFIRRLNDKTNGGYRLPTEAEWEYACRAKTTTKYFYGDIITKSDANYGGAAGAVIKQVGSYKPNAFGLYDMHGNVWEWCNDWYGRYSSDAEINPVGPLSGTTRVLRGGSFNDSDAYFRSSYRIYVAPGHRPFDSGLRLARTNLSAVGSTTPKVVIPAATKLLVAPFTEAKAKEIQKQVAKALTKEVEEKEDLGKEVKIDLVLIPAGRFMMGDPGKDHEVTITQPFYMAKYEVTQEQWESVMGSNPSTKTKGAKLPVTDVSWADCQDFIKKLNDKTKGGYRLPTEAEWEYACRAGTKTAYSFGDVISKADANYDGETIKPVGNYKPNAFGLYDMHGNVWEWCNDWFADYDPKDNKDPQGVSSGERKVVRGGSFFLNESFSRSFTRGDGDAPTIRNNYDGLRLVRSN